MSKSLATRNVAAVALGIGLILALAFSFATPAKAQTIADLQAQIQALLAQIAALQTSTSTGGAPVSGAGCYTFTRNHSQGDTGGEVMWIQQFLNNHGVQVAASGAGSPGNETSYFGSLTKAAVVKFQDMYAADILAPVGLSSGTGYWGPSSRAKANALCAGMTPGGPVTTPGGPVVVPVGQGLRVMLAADSPAASTIVKSQGIALLAKFTFTNGSGAPVTVTNLAFKRIGVSTDSDLSNIYLYDGAKRLTDPAGISSGNFNFNASAGLFTVPAGGSVSVSVRADIGSTNGNQIGVQLTGVTASAPLDASVVLPVSGNLHLISNASIATATWGAATPSGVTFAPANEITVFQATLTVNTRASWLHSVQFENRGTTADSDFANFKLYVKGVQVGTVQQISGDKIVFDLTANPLKLETGGNEIRLVADVLGTSGKNFDFQIRRGTDILLVDSELNQPLAPSAPSTVTANEVEGIGLSVTKANTSPTENVAVASTNVLWSRFEFRASGDDVKVEALTVDVDNSVLATDSMDNVRIMLDGVQVGSTADLDDDGVSFSLGSSMVLKLGKTHVVEIYGDAKTSTSTNFAASDAIDVGVSIAVADTEGIASGDRLGSAISEVEGNSRTMTSSTLTGSKSSGYGNQTMVAGTNNAKIGAFTLSTGSTEGVNVNTIVINLAGNNSASVTELRLVDNATGAQIGTSKSSAAATNSFGVNLPMSASQTKTINVIANIKSGIPTGTIVATLDDTTGGTGAVTGQSVTVGTDQTLQTITVGSGTLTVTRDPGTPVNANVIAGTNSIHVGKFDFDAQNASFTIQELRIKVPNDAATSVSNVTLKYKDSAGVEQTASQALTTGSEQYATATFTGLTMYVPQNDSADLDVYVDVPTVASGAHSAAAISVLISHESGFKAVDGAGNTDTSAASSDVNSAASTGYGTMYVRKTIPTLARLTTGYTTNTVASGTGLYRFSVTADSAGTIEWREISFTVTTVAMNAYDWILYDVTSGTAVAVSDTATTTNAGGSGTNLSICVDTNCQNGDVEQIGAGSSKTYELQATVSGWGTAGDSITIAFAEDTSFAANNTAANLHTAQNMVWSDRSASSHATTTTDWTNGYLVKDMTNDTRSCQFGTATTCTP